MVTESPIAVLDVVIEKLIGVDPSRPTVPALLPNPTHTTNMVATNAINEQPRIQVVQNVVQNVGHDDMVLKRARTSQDPDPNVVAPSILHSPVGVPPDHVGPRGVGLDVMEMLQNMPNNATLKELLEFSLTVAQLCRE